MKAFMDNKKTCTKLKKRGRPRILGKLREPNGRISRAKDSNQKLAVMMRAKHYGLTLEQASDPKAETHIGRLSLRGKENGLSQEQYEAALHFLKIRNDYQKTLLSPGAIYENKSMGKTSVYDMNEYKKWVERVQKRYKLALNAIQEAQFDNAKENLYGALQYIVIENQDLPHLLGAARMVLNALHRHFLKTNKTPQRKKPIHNISLGNMKYPVQKKGAAYKIPTNIGVKEKMEIQVSNKTLH